MIWPDAVTKELWITMNNRPHQFPIETQESFEVIDGIESDYDELPDFTPGTPNTATGTLLDFINISLFLSLSPSFNHYFSLHWEIKMSLSERVSNDHFATFESRVRTVGNNELIFNSLWWSPWLRKEFIPSWNTSFSYNRTRWKISIISNKS